MYQPRRFINLPRHEMEIVSRLKNDQAVQSSYCTLLYADQVYCTVHFCMLTRSMYTYSTVHWDRKVKPALTKLCSAVLHCTL